MAILITCPVCHSDEVDFLNPQAQPTQAEMDEYEFWTENMGMEPPIMTGETYGCDIRSAYSQVHIPQPDVEAPKSYGPVWIGCNECFLIWDECAIQRDRRFPYGKLN
jgi:hypothetical protein